MDSKQVIARFEAERQALALMDHPNIAKVLDGGATPDGRPFFVIELVNGTPITTYCDEKKLSVRERLALFSDVCLAVQHAHQKGIIHRDIKPSNVLVAPYDGRPVVKVIDFGVAKATGQKLTEATLHTGFGSVVGTPEYMSPEQAEVNNQDVDTRSDIYSLGVLLYELLTGSTPLTRERVNEAAFLEVLRVIREEEPPKPSTRLSGTEELPSISAQRQCEPARLTKVMRGELDWIVMKALEKDRNRRYETANSLAMDVQRYLADEPVQAHPLSAAYRLRKFAQRHKGPVLASSLVLLMMVVAIIGTTWGFFRAERQRLIAEENEQKANGAAEAEKQERQRAQAREAEAKQLLQFVEEKVIAAARPEGQAGGLGRNVTVRKALETALTEIESRFADQPLVEARLRFTLGTSFANLGERKIALDQIERAHAIRNKHLGHDHPDTLVSTLGLASIYGAFGRHADAIKLQKETLELMKVKLGPDDPKTLAAMNNLAISYATVGEQDKALKLNEETLAIRKAKFGPDDPATLGSMNNLAGNYRNLGRHDDALKLSLETVARTKDKLGPRSRTTLACTDTLASIYHSRGQFDEAVKLFESTLPLMKDVLGPDHGVTLSCMAGLANSYSALDRYSEELKVRDEIVAIRQAKFHLADPEGVDSLNLLAYFLAICPNAKLRDPKRALELAQKSVELAPQLEWSWQALGWARYRTGAWQESITALEKSLLLRKFDGDPFQWFFFAMAHWKLGDKAAARKWYDRSVEWMEKNSPKDKYLLRFRAEADELINKKTKPE
jgi:tetratricopeptide (TPR) repeat protein